MSKTNLKKSAKKANFIQNVQSENRSLDSFHFKCLRRLTLTRVCALDIQVTLDGENKNFFYSTFCVTKDDNKFHAKSEHRFITFQMSQKINIALDNSH